MLFPKTLLNKYKEVWLTCSSVNVDFTELRSTLRNYFW